jgi:hypothetical protein
VRYVCISNARRSKVEPRSVPLAVQAGFIEDAFYTIPLRKREVLR